MTEKTIKAFDPNEHLENIKGKPYLPVQWRLVWVRSEHPDWTIQTEVYQLTDKSAIMKATISQKGNVLATAHKKEDVAGFGDFMEKAETGAIGRALAMCGYGTQFAPELEEGTQRIVDSPVNVKTASTPIFEAQNTKNLEDMEKQDVVRGDISDAQLKKIQALYHEKELNITAMKALLKGRYGKTSHKELTKKEASEWISYLIEDVQPKVDVSDLDGGIPNDFS